MRFHELKGGFNIPLSNEEYAILKRVKKTGSLKSDEMDERDLEVANKLYSKRVFNRDENEHETYTFTIDELEEAWRD